MVATETPLRLIVRGHRGRLLLTYGLFVMESAIDLLQPLALGCAVEAFLSGQGAGLILFALQQSSALGLGVARRYWDARFFNRLAAMLAEQLVLCQRARGVELSCIAARASLSNQIVEFLERDLPFLTHSLIQAVGTIVMLGLVAPKILPATLILLLAAGTLCAVYVRFAHRFTRRLHDELERTVGIVDGADPQRVRDHFVTIGHARQLHAQAEGLYFGVCQTLGLGFLAAIFLGDPTPRNAGEWTAILGYARLLLTSLVNALRLLDQMIRVRDVLLRVHSAPSAAA